MALATPLLNSWTAGSEVAQLAKPVTIFVGDSTGVSAYPAPAVS